MMNPTLKKFADNNGNITSDGFFTFTYDLENKLVSALPINAGVRTLSYDPLNRLDVYNPGTARRFIYDGAEVVAELDSSGNIIARYVRGDSPDEILVGYTSADPTARGWYHLDQRSSVVAITDPNGTATVVNRYDEYGQPQGGNYGTFQYTGQMWLGEIGVYNYKNRMVWPNERPGGRFMQTDPVGPVDSPNLYQYALNDPVNLSDPLGLCSEETWVCGAGGPTAPAFGGASISVAVGNAYRQFRGLDCETPHPQCPEIDVVGKRSRRPSPLPRTLSQWTQQQTSVRVDLAAATQPVPNDYCGSTGTEAVPDKVGGTDITGPCANHDACYGSLTEREQCDRQLMFEIWRECKRQSNTVACYAAGPIYYYMLRAFGGPAYRRAH